MSAPNDSLSSTYLNYFSFLTSGNKNQRSVWLTCAWTPWSCLCCGAVAACTSPRPSRSTWGWGSRRSWSDHPPPCAPWRLMLPKPRDSVESGNTSSGGGVGGWGGWIFTNTIIMKKQKHDSTYTVAMSDPKTSLVPPKHDFVWLAPTVPTFTSNIHNKIKWASQGSCITISLCWSHLWRNILK